MSENISVRSNWISVDCRSVDLVCDVAFEDEDQSTVSEKETEQNEIDTPRDPTVNKLSDENPTSITLRWNSNDQREDPVVTIDLRQPDEHQLTSIQILSSARHIEFYHQEYLGTCQGSRITELENQSIYESNFDFDRAHDQINLKFLKLADASELILFCLQINLNRRKIPSTVPSVAINRLPFDLNRVRSMIDENNLSSNARQLMNDFQHLQERQRTNQSSSSQFNMGQLMLMIKGMNTMPTSSTIKTSSPTPPTASSRDEQRSTLANDRLTDELNAFEKRFQTHFETVFTRFQEHFDQRFNQLEEKLDKLEKEFHRST